MPERRVQQIRVCGNNGNRSIAACAQQPPLGCQRRSIALRRDQTEPRFPSQGALAATENPRAREGPKSPSFCRCTRNHTLLPKHRIQRKTALMCFKERTEILSFSGYFCTLLYAHRGAQPTSLQNSRGCSCSLSPTPWQPMGCGFPSQWVPVLQNPAFPNPGM